MKRAKTLSALSLAIIMLFVVGCTRTNDSESSYTWLREGETLNEEGLRFSAGEISNVTLNTAYSSINIRTHNSDYIFIEYVPLPAIQGGNQGNLAHHYIIWPRYVQTSGHLEIFKEVALEPGTAIRGGEITIFVPTYEGIMFDGLILSNTVGSIEMSGFTVDTATINSGNGDLIIANVGIEGNLTLQTAFSNIDISNSYVGGILSAVTTHGNITLTNVDTEIENADLNTSNGDVIIN